MQLKFNPQESTVGPVAMKINRLIASVLVFLGLSLPVYADGIQDWRDWVLSEGGTAYRSLESHLGDIKSFKDFGAVCDGSTDDTASLSSAITWVQAVPKRGILQVGGNCKITTPLPPLTALAFSVRGVGSTITQAGTDGRVWIVQGAGRMTISGFSYTWTGTGASAPGVDDHLVDLQWGNDNIFSDFRVNNCPSLISYGSATLNSTTRNTFLNWSGDCLKNVNTTLGTSADALILEQNGASGRFINFVINCSAGANNGTQAYIKWKPTPGGGLDTFVYDHVGFQCLGGASVTTPPASANGNSYGIYADRTNGDITNHWVLNGTFDHTTNHNFYFTGSDLLTNEGFDSDTVWTKGTGWTIAAGTATHAAGSASSLTQPITISTLAPGATYSLTYTVTGRTAGTVTSRLSGGTNVDGTPRSTNNSIVDNLTAVAGNNTVELVASSDFNGTIDNVSFTNGGPLDRNIHIVHNRMVSDAGSGIEYDFSNYPLINSQLTVRDLDISNNFNEVSQNTYNIRIRGRNIVKNTVIIGNKLADWDPTTPKTAAISMDTSEFIVSSNTVGGDQNTGTGYVNGIQIENGANDNFTVANNNMAAGVGYITEPTYTTTNGSRRIVGGKIDQWITPSQDVTNSTTTIADVTGMTIALEANSSYLCDGTIDFETDATTTGIGLTINSALSDYVRWAHRFSIPTTQSGSVAPTVALGRAPQTGTNVSASVDTANATMMATVNASIVTGPTAGTATVQFKSEVAASVATVRKAGSVLHCHKQVG
jgi:hypothetical protein